MRYSLHQEAKALKMQQDAVMMQAEAIMWQRKTALIRLGALQRMEAAVAATPLDVLHPFLKEHSSALLKAVVTGDPAKGVAASMDVITQQLVAAGKAGARIHPTEEVRFPDCRRVCPQPLPEGTLEHPIPYLMKDGAKSEIRYISTSKDVARCSVAGCDVQGGTGKVEAHIREAHTRQVLVCPNGDECTRKGGVMMTFSLPTLRHHYKAEGPLSVECNKRLADWVAASTGTKGPGAEK